MTKLPPRSRKVRILATLGPASATPDMLRALFVAGAAAARPPPDDDEVVDEDERDEDEDKEEEDDM